MADITTYGAIIQACPGLHNGGEGVRGGGGREGHFYEPVEFLCTNKGKIKKLQN